MRVSQLGEFALIDRLARMVSQAEDRQKAPGQQLIIGIGDDAAAWQGDAATQLATVDSLVQDVHFSLDNTPWEDLGGKALAVNLSDIAAMGGVPRYALVALGLPADTGVEDVTALYRGMIELAQQCGVAIIGGDVNRAPIVIITITVLGSAAKRGALLTRSAAVPGEQIAVTGYLGAAAGGYEMLTGRLEFAAEAAEPLRNAFLRPQPRLAEGQLLAAQGARAAIDISDGLVADLAHVCQQSGVGARVEAERVPVHQAAKAGFGDRSLEMALSGGEDYELLFTAPGEVVRRVKEAAPCPITVIGETTGDNKGEVTLVDRQGNRVSLEKRGWEHFYPR